MVSCVLPLSAFRTFGWVITYFDVRMSIINYVCYVYVCQQEIYLNVSLLELL